MKTLMIPVNPSNLNERALVPVIQKLHEGCIALIPTETGYCLVGDPTAPNTLKSFLEFRKEHPKQKPFSLICSSIEQACQFAQFHTPDFRLAKKCFPGPYTLVVNCNRNTPRHAYSPKKDTVGIRVSAHPITQRILELFEKPLLITSVTDGDEIVSSGYYQEEHDPEHWWTRAFDICEHYKGKIAAAIELEEHLPLRVSTVIDVSGGEIIMIRDGGWGSF